MSEELRENKMGTMPVGKLVLNMSLPMMISMLVQALYNIVDSVFVAMLSENALTAVSMAFPLQTLLIAVGAGTGVGMNAFQIPWRKKFRKSQPHSQQRCFPVRLKLPGFPGSWSYGCKTILRQSGT